GLESFRQGLREHGYSEGRDVVIARNVDVLVVPGTLQARVAKQATRTIPIVFASSGDPVASGLVTSLARPGGNLTGLCSLGQELIAKRLELLRYTVPKVSRVAVLWTASAAGDRTEEEARTAAEAPPGR